MVKTPVNVVPPLPARFKVPSIVVLPVNVLAVGVLLLARFNVPPTMVAPDTVRV